MNFYDFFLFITRFAFTNLILLHHLHEEEEDPTGMPLSLIVSQLAFNLVSILKVALSMESSEGLLCNPDIVHSAEMSLDPKFLELCSTLGKTYEITHGSEIQSCGTWKEKLGDLDIMKILSEIRTPRDLVNCMDGAVKELGSSAPSPFKMIFKFPDRESVSIEGRNS